MNIVYHAFFGQNDSIVLKVLTRLKIKYLLPYLLIVFDQLAYFILT